MKSQTMIIKSSLAVVVRLTTLDQSKHSLQDLRALVFIPSVARLPGLAAASWEVGRAECPLRHKLHSRLLRPL